MDLAPEHVDILEDVELQEAPPPAINDGMSLTASINGQSQISEPENTEIWQTLVTSQIACQLDQPISEVEATVRKLIWAFNVSSMASLASIPEHVLLRQGLPAAFCHLVRHGFPHDSRSSEIEAHMWTHGFDVGLSAEEIKHVVDCIVQRHWFETWESLKALPLPLWGKLGIRNSMLLRKTQVLMDQYGTSEKQRRATPIEIEDLFTSIGLRLNKDQTEMLNLAESVRSQDIDSVAELFELTDTELVKLKLPMRVFLELRSIRPLTEAGTPATAVSLNDSMGSEYSPSKLGALDEATTTYEEPDTTTFLKQIGNRHAHTYEEVKVVVDILVGQHWLKSLGKLRDLTDRDWEELYLPRKFVTEIREGLLDPSLLNMTAVWQAEPPADLFPATVAESLASLKAEVSEEDKPALFRQFLRLLEILIVMPANSSKRSLNKQNDNYQRCAAKYISVPIFLQSVSSIFTPSKAHAISSLGMLTLVLASCFQFSTFGGYAKPIHCLPLRYASCLQWLQHLQWMR
eukprot:Protomagalhaensia_wolfi_Nauph_80__1416@NODE_184_length_3258_cov_117_338614_g139_i0_p1_GENE_NODE_184_length_3258_cov_117_338614_g139_i0NODE_184_length_3258_cov_117_338614_g139_i0_p1_ORF_typecomplete_len517_score85_05SAS4/PF15460_6/1_6e04SAS4/PF15460_6/0_12ORC4_C/PF14629_6/1_6e03ORC4_C/PF14629_6/13ORC4_C/PF14629_6/47_NODE_184_length_3258_cov_117_338614_g139_i016353185